ncbi:helix-turn-helix domain-containing protein [Actinacidiphila glaucinigra]|uniref:helix-turn-helix domain-containing protein n=1 Tax=Actinacidiphila glaucinigra TaxID=235986 RepID=UPI0035E00BCF
MRRTGHAPRNGAGATSTNEKKKPPPSIGTAMAHKSPARKLTGPERNRIAIELKTKYEAGASIRTLAKESSRSYGNVHHLLETAGATFRPRGGVRRAGRPWEETSNYSKTKAVK